MFIGNQSMMREHTAMKSVGVDLGAEIPDPFPA
jgi:hypothetical protein